MRFLSALTIGAAILILGASGCKDSGKVDDSLDEYVILDLQVSPEWQQTHSASVEWQGKSLSLPAVFRLGKRCEHGHLSDVDPPTVTFLVHKDRLNVELSGVLRTSPKCRLSWGVQLENILPAGGKATSSPSGTTYDLPQGDKLQHVTIYTLWPEGEQKQRTIGEIQQMLAGQVTVVEAPE